MELEVIESYILGEEGVGAEKRYRIKVKDTTIVLNVRASSLEEALAKARAMLASLTGKRSTLS